MFIRETTPRNDGDGVYRKAQVLTTDVAPYKYNVHLVTSVDGGRNYYYCGCGKWCKTMEEANNAVSRFEAGIPYTQW